MDPEIQAGLEPVSAPKKNTPRRVYILSRVRAPDHPPQTSEKSEVFLFRNVEISAFREWYQLIRSIDRVSLEVLHFSKKCYSPGGAMTAGIFTFMPVLFREVASSLHPVSGRNSS